ncbi:3'-5' exonuclease [Pedobacter polaris]|uniref:3'-5' exonuclease n=1 Tax=Pedobacter polaris TaxID=2571273 RepID=A0A4U1CQZ7_9SPHI|nr:3'-5' exonuclease [Pedobacter polaris]TKC10557.1 3'-5' exonuclease [Pedobacter polaris]
MLKDVNLNKVFVIDIETVPLYEYFEQMPLQMQELWDSKTQFLRKDDKTPSDFYERAGIWAEFGKIICISVGLFHNQKGKLNFRINSYFGHDEVDILNQFSKLLSQQPKDQILCAHNGKEFDFPYLCRRMLVNNISIPLPLQIAGKKPWEINHIDTMELWKFGDYKNYTSLNLLAAIFGIPTPKDDIDGSMVKEVYYQEKDLQRIVTYCQKDVITTAQILLRFKGLDAIPSENITLVK